MNFDEFLISLSKIKNIPLPGESSQFKMAPPFRKELLGQYKKTMRTSQRASVLALFYPDNLNQTRFVLILRKSYQGVHSAQIGLPGGKYEKTDNSLMKTATRETYEEIGVPEDRIQVIKEMTKIYIPPSNFHVQPYIGVTNAPPFFNKQLEEVETIIEVMLTHFLDELTIKKASVISSEHAQIEVPAFVLNGHVVWGATAMILSEIKDLLNEVLES